VDDARAPVTIRRAAINRLATALGGVGLTTFVGGLAVAALYYPLRNSAYPVQWLLVFALMVGESMAIHLPSEVILPAGGWLVVRDHGLGLPGVLALSGIAAAGNTLGSGLLYVAGRAGGPRLVRRYGRYLLIDEAQVSAAERRMRRHAVRAVLAARVLPVVRTYVGFPAGLLRVPAPQFLAATFGGSFAWCVAFVALGAILGARWDAARRPAEAAGLAVVAVLLVAALVLTARQLRGAGAAKR